MWLARGSSRAGEGLEEVSVRAVREWHLPLSTSRGNEDMKVAKYAGRFDLGFSDVTRTIEVHEHDQLAHVQGCGSPT